MSRIGMKLLDRVSSDQEGLLGRLLNGVVRAGVAPIRKKQA